MRPLFTLSKILRIYRQTGDLRGVRIPKVTDPKQIWMFKGLLNMVKELHENGIDTPDYGNPSNLGIKPSGSLGMFDMGFGNAFEDFDEDLERIVLEKNTDILSKIKEIMGIKRSRYLGGGMFGYAHYIGNNTVMKITKDKSEAVNSRKVLGKKNKYLSNVYDVRAFKTARGEELYVIILEMLKTPKELPKIYEKLKSHVESQRNVHLDVSVLNNIKDVIIRKFLMDIVKYGDRKGWEMNRENVKNYNDKKIDFNDIQEIADWIKGSLSNQNDPTDEVPNYIIKDLKKLSR